MFRGFPQPPASKGCPVSRSTNSAKSSARRSSRLQLEGRMRDLATIDSKLRGCDVVAIKVEDVAPHGYAADRATVRQRKTGRPVRFELPEQTAQPVERTSKLRARNPAIFCELVPRMPAEAMIRTGERTVAFYAVSPISRRLPRRLSGGVI